MRKDPRVYLAQIVERIDRILEYSAGGKEAFFADEKTQDAVIRNLEVIAKAIKLIPAGFRKKHPNIAWRELAGLLDILMYHYEGVSIRQVWQMVDTELSPLRRAIAEILPPLTELEKQIAGSDKPAGP